MEAIEEVLKSLVARGLDGAHIFTSIFLHKVRVLSASWGKMWDYERGESQEELWGSGAPGLWKWLDGLIMGETCRAISGPSPY